MKETKHTPEDNNEGLTNKLKAILNGREEVFGEVDNKPCRIFKTHDGFEVIVYPQRDTVGFRKDIFDVLSDGTVKTLPPLRRRPYRTKEYLWYSSPKYSNLGAILSDFKEKPEDTK